MKTHCHASTGKYGDTCDSCYLDKWYKIAKIIAENDSIGEGYGYCENYNKEQFGKEIKIGEYGYASVAREILDIS